MTCNTYVQAGSLARCGHDKGHAGACGVVQLDPAACRRPLPGAFYTCHLPAGHVGDCEARSGAVNGRAVVVRWCVVRAEGDA